MAVDAIFADMHEALGRPPIMLVDNWPLVPPMVVVASHEVAEQVSKPSNYFPQFSAPKSPSVDHIVSLIGPHSILFNQVSTPDTQISYLTEMADQSPRMNNGKRSAKGSIQALRRDTS